MPWRELGIIIFVDAEIAGMSIKQTVQRRAGTTGLTTMIKSKLKKIIRDAADKKYTKKIDMSFIDGAGLYNHACHLNAVNRARDGSSCAVVEVVVIDDKSVIAHYINMQSDGTYVDYTLGWHWSGADYRFVRYVPFTEWSDIAGSLSRLKAELCKPVAKWQKLLMVTDGELC